jgi:hypothetical protein
MPAYLLQRRNGPGGHVPAKQSPALPILARSLFKEMRSAKYTPREILTFVNALLDLVTAELKRPVVTEDE